MDRPKTDKKHSGFRQMIMLILQNMTIKHKLISIIMATCIVALLLAGIILILWEWSMLRHTMARSLSTQAEMIADNCKASLTFNDPDDARQTLSALRVESSIIFGGVYNKKGELFASYHRYGVDRNIQSSEIQKSGYTFGEGFLTVFKAIILDDETIGTVCLRSDLHPMYAVLKRNTEIVAAVLLLASVVAYFVSSRLQSIISAPILSLAESARKIGKGDLGHRVEIRSNDELGYLALSFNNMAEDLEQTTTSIDNLNREISERKRAEQALQASESKYRTLLENLPQKIFLKDRNSVYLSCNQNYASDLAIKPQEIAGRTDYEFYPKELAEKYRADDQRIMQSGHVETIEEKYLLYGQEVLVQTVKTPVKDDHGNVAGILGIFWDITDRKKAEQRQAELLKKVESANKELRDFAYVVSHDLKAPLRGIKTLAQWLSTDYADSLDQNGKEQMNLLLSRVDRMHNLIEGVLQYSRVGRVQEEKAQVNLNELVAAVVDSIAPPQNIAVTVENDLPVIECERTRIAQVFQNLLSNAVKFMDKPEGRVRIACVEEDGFWKFSVADNGPGIEEKYFEKIFQMFQTLSPRDDVESTGVGLTVAKKIVELYGGKIWVESKVGEGSTFLFTIPKDKVRIENAELQASIVG